MDIYKLNKDIVEAQDKLEQINSAINRDRLIMEEITKTKDELLKEQESLISDIKKLKQKKNESELNTIKVIEENIATNEKLNDDKHKKQAIIKSLDDTIIETQDKLAKISDARRKNTKDMESEYNSIQKKLEEELGKQIELNEKAKKENEQLAKDNEDLKLNKDSLQSDISEIEARLEAKHIEFSEYDDKITQAKMDHIEKAKQSEDLVNSIQSLSIQEWEIRSIIAELNGKKAELEVQIDQNNKVLAQYVQDKMQLLKDKETLKEKEDYIREKFQAAGLHYS